MNECQKATGIHICSYIQNDLSNKSLERHILLFEIDMSYLHALVEFCSDSNTTLDYQYGQ